jgi:adenylate cyclase
MATMQPQMPVTAIPTHLPSAQLPTDSSAFAEAALEKNKQEGLWLAIRVRWVALVLVGILLAVINPQASTLYYEALLLAFLLLAFVQRRIGRAGASPRELMMMFGDLVLMTFTLVVPHPWAPASWPVAMQFHQGNFIYFFVLLGAATLAYSWRTVITMGVGVSILWSAAVFWASFQPVDHALSARVRDAMNNDERMLRFMDPTTLNPGLRIEEIIVFLIVSVTVALAVRRSNNLVISQAAVERERTNLARYFSPTVVAELAQNDEPLKQVRTQNVAVLFVDIVGFTGFADGKSPQEVIDTLREFHGLMEHQVFEHEGTLDKYLGDGLMATFGTPFVGERDASNALKCARAMMAAIAQMNVERTDRGEPAVRVSFGLHYGPVVLGDIGMHRLEFAVIGSTVNVASRLSR